MYDENYLIENGVDLKSSLELLGDISFYNQTLEAFLEENHSRIPKIEKYREECNMNEYSILVHSLKSDAKYLGFNELAEIAYIHELASKNNELDEINNRYKEFHDAIIKYTNIGETYLNKGNRPKKIIVADESPVISNIVKKAFEGEYEVLVATNGKEAISLVQNNIYEDIFGLILDLNMPEYDGFTVLDYFKANDLFSKVRVFIITGEVEEEKIERAKSYDIKDVLPKPFTLESIKEAMILASEE